MAHAGHGAGKGDRGLGLASLREPCGTPEHSRLADLPSVRELLAAPVVGSSPYYQPDGRTSRATWDSYAGMYYERSPPPAVGAQPVPESSSSWGQPASWAPAGAAAPPGLIREQLAALRASQPAVVPTRPPPSFAGLVPDRWQEGACGAGHAEGAAGGERSRLLEDGGRYAWWSRMRDSLADGDRHDHGRVARYGEELCQLIDKWLSRDDGRGFKDDVDLAMFVRKNLSTERGCVYWLLIVITCGIWLLFRRGPATELLVLTKTGRLILVESAPTSVFGTSQGLSQSMLLWHFFLLVLLTAAPVAVLLAIAPQSALFHGIAKLEGVADESHSVVQKLHDKLQERAIWYFALIAALWLAFLCWLLRHRQRGYSNRAFREFKAQAVCSAQYGLEHGGLRPSTCTRAKAGKLRFFFGKFAGKAEMDTGLPPSCPEGSAVVPLARVSDEASTMSLNKRESSAEGRGASGEQARQSRRSAPCVSLVLLFCSTLTQVLVLYSVAVEVANGYKAGDFCSMASQVGPSECKPSHCEEYAVEQRLPNYKFCEAISWIDKEDANAAEICAGTLGGMDAHGGCCAYCVAAEMFWWLGGDDPGAWAQTASQFLSLLVLFLALAVSRQAAIAEFGAMTHTNCLEVEFVENFQNPDREAFLLSEEIAMMFLDRVFRMAGPAFATQAEGPAARRAAQQRLLDGGQEEFVPELDHEPRNWHERFKSRKRLAEVSGRPCRRSFQVSSVPTKCIGLIDADAPGKGEQVVSAWAEMPAVTYTQAAIYMALSAVVSCFVVFWPREHGGSVIRIQECAAGTDSDGNDSHVLEEKFLCNVYRFLWVAALTALLTPALLAFRHRVAVALETIVVIVTDERVYAVYHNWGWGRFFAVCLGCCCCDPSMALRVDVFRHGDGIYYGRMNTKVPLWFDRLFNASYEPGDVIAQSIFGVFKIERRFGNVEKVYNMVARVLSRDVPDLNIEREYRGRNFSLLADGPFCHGIDLLPNGRPNMGIDANGFWWVPQQKASPADGMFNVRDCHIANTKGKLEETPLFVWSFLERGKITSPFDAYNDIIVTTDRVRLHSQVYWKFFDCRSCFCWGACWCFCLRRCLWWVLGNAQLPSSRSFLNFTHLVSFATETSVTPSRVWLRCPCWLFCCSACTAAAHCRCSMCPEANACCGWPREEPPKVQLWLLFLQKWAQAVQADMVLSVRPYKLPELFGPDGDSVGGHRDTPEVQELRNLMRVVLKRREEAQRSSPNGWGGAPWGTADGEEEPPPE